MAVKKKFRLEQKQPKASNKSKKKKTKKVYKRFQYTNKALQECLERIKAKELSICKASKQYNIPKATLIKKLAKNENSIGKVGPPPVLSEEEEQMIVTWIIEKSRVGYPMHPKVVKSAIQNILQKHPRVNPFNNNRPGNKWFKLFLKRHPIIALKHHEVISKSRASVTEEAIRKWFHGLKQYLIEENSVDILDDPSRIFNMDEIGIPLCPRTGKLLGETKEKNNYYVSPGQDKENITVLASYSASGKAIRPMIVYPYKRFPPKDIANSVPDGYVIGHSPSGYMTGDTFNQFIENGFYPQLVADKVKFPVALLFDGHGSHISMHLHNFCKNVGIHLYLLYPNATHIMQPCDVGIFKPLKVAWRQVVAEHAQDSTKPVTKTNFAPLFNKAFERASDPKVIKKAFECCGLFPFNPDAINYTKCISTRRQAMKGHVLEEYIALNQNAVSDSSDALENVNELCHSDGSTPTLSDNPTASSINSLQLIESNIPENILNKFRHAYENEEPPSEEVVLFELWKKIKMSTETNECHQDIIKSGNTSADVCSQTNNDVFEKEPTEEIESQEDMYYNQIEDIPEVPESLYNEAALESNNQPLISYILDNTGGTENWRPVEIIQTVNESTLDTSPVMNQEKSNQEISITHTNETLSLEYSNSEINNTNSPMEDLAMSDTEAYGDDNTSSVERGIILPVDLSMNLQQCHIAIDSTKEYGDSNNNSDENSCVLSVGTSSSQENVGNEFGHESNQSLSSSNLRDVWRKELHFPTIIKSKKKIKTEKPKIFAITSEAFKKEQEEKISKQLELQKMKELKKFKREITKKIKQEEVETKKKERLKLQEAKKLKEELIKKEAEARVEMLLKEKAKLLELQNVDTGVLAAKKRKVLEVVSNTET